MFWLLSRIVVWPVKAVLGTTKVATKATTKTASGSFKAGYGVGRLLGFRRMTVLAIGVGIGLAIAPRPGRELREQVRQRLEERGLLRGALPPVEAVSSSPVERPSPLPDVAAADASAASHAPASNGQVDALTTEVVTTEAIADEPGTGPV